MIKSMVLFYKSDSTFLLTCLTDGAFFWLILYRKYEEIVPPHVEDFCYITDNTYDKQEVSIFFIIPLFNHFEKNTDRF